MKLKVGDKVHYIPFKGCDKKLIENGKVKIVYPSIVFVVYQCNNEWNKWMEYTSQSTLIENLKKGWYNWHEKNNTEMI